MTKNIEIGMLGEDIAEKYLLDNNYKILGRNIRMKCGEIDIVSMKKDGTIVFVEVKTMSESYNGLIPEDQMSKAKRMKFERVASIYANQLKNIDEQKGWQLDLVSIVLKKGGEPIITHYENI